MGGFHYHLHSPSPKHFLCYRILGAVEIPTKHMGDDGVAVKNMIAYLKMVVAQNLIFDNDHLMDSLAEK